MFVTTCLEYLGFRINTDGITPLEEKVEAIRKIAPPKTLKQLRSYIGLYNFYKQFYPLRSHILSPLTDAVTAKRRFQWTAEMQEAFDKSKELVANTVKLVYPDFTKPFYIDTDASDLQLGGVIYQKHGIIAYFSKKLNSAQKNYTIPEKELLSIVTILQVYRKMLLGSKIFLSTDALNLCYREQRSARILRWFLLLQEYDIDLRHIPGLTNETSDALSRLPRLDDIDPFNEDHLVFPTREITYCAKLKDVPFPPGIDLLYEE